MEIDFKNLASNLFEKISTLESDKGIDRKQIEHLKEKIIELENSNLIEFRKDEKFKQLEAEIIHLQEQLSSYRDMTSKIQDLVGCNCCEG